MYDFYPKLKANLNYLIAIILLFTACNSRQGDNSNQGESQLDISERILYPKRQISPLIDSLRPQVEIFMIKGNRDTVLVGKKGMTFSIAKNTFINSSRQVPAELSISLVEITSISDMVAANLHTTSDGSILQTGGMFFIDARENNKALTIAEGKSISTEVATNHKYLKTKIFEGRFDTAGKINWIQSKSNDSYLIALPLNLLDFTIGGLECKLPEEYVQLLLKPEFENTNISTREFEERLSVIQFASCEQYNGLGKQLVSIYKNNINHPLFYSDSLVVEYILKNHRGDIDTTSPFQFDTKGWMTFFYKSFCAFKDQHLGSPIKFENNGINENTTRDYLSTKGYSEIEADRIIKCLKLRKEIIESRKSKKVIDELASYSFSINKLGWVNIDRFLDNETMSLSNFEVKIACRDTLPYISVSLVIPSINASLFSIHNEGALYSFTKKMDGYRKLPLGNDAVIVALAYKNNKYYFAKKKIKIPKDGQVELQINSLNIQTIKSEILNLKE